MNYRVPETCKFTCGKCGVEKDLDISAFGKTEWGYLRYNDIIKPFCDDCFKEVLEAIKW